MLGKKPLHLLALLSTAMVCSASFLSGTDKDRLRNVFKTSLAQEDLPSVAYSILGYKLLGEAAPDSANLCKKLQKGIEGQDVQVVAVYQAVVAAKAIDGCSLQLSAAASKVPPKIRFIHVKSKPED
jgi:Oligosaccharyltransferase subunit Ribophorin II